jgi:hypothetical protein
LKNSIQDILHRLSIGEIDSEKAVNLIKNIDTNSDVVRRKASKLKIIVVDKKENQSIRIPAIPFWLLSFLGSMGLGIGSIALRFSKNLDEYPKEALKAINSKDLRKILKEIKKYGPFDLVDVDDGDGTIVKISVF